MNYNTDHMSDDDVLSFVSDALSGVPVARPPRLEAVMAGGRARRRRRRISGAALAVAVVAGGAAAGVVVTTPPAGKPPANSVPAVGTQLTAWSVARQANGDIFVSVRELADPAGLQRTLRADGVPASVTFLDQQNPACRSYGRGTDQSLLVRIFFPQLAGGQPEGSTVATRGGVTIVPSAIPSGVGVQLAWTRIGKDLIGHQGLVQASPQCTGS